MPTLDPNVCDLKTALSKTIKTDTGDELCVRVCADDALPITTGAVGTPVFDEFVGTTTIGTTTVISNSVPVGKTWKLTQVNVSCRQRIVYQVKIGATIVGSGRTGPGNLDSTFIFNPTRSASASSSVTIDIIQSIGPISDIEIYFMALES